MKTYYIQFNVGMVKYLVNFHNGIDKHKDGSEFFNIATFRNKKKMNLFIKALKAENYIYKY